MNANPIIQNNFILFNQFPDKFIIALKSVLSHNFTQGLIEFNFFSGNYLQYHSIGLNSITKQLIISPIVF